MKKEIDVKLPKLRAMPTLLSLLAEEGGEHTGLWSCAGGYRGAGLIISCRRLAGNTWDFGADLAGMKGCPYYF